MSPPLAGGDHAETRGQALIVSTVGKGTTEPATTVRVRVASPSAAMSVMRMALTAVGPVRVGTGRAGSAGKGGSGTGNGSTLVGFDGLTAELGSSATSMPPLGTMGTATPSLTQ